MKLIDRGADIGDRMTERVNRQANLVVDGLISAMEKAQALREPIKNEMRNRVRDRLDLGPRRTRRFTVMTLLFGTGIGLLASYLWDPAHGATRRQRIREQVRTAARRTSQAAQDQIQTVSTKAGMGGEPANTTELTGSPVSSRVDSVVGNGEKHGATSTVHRPTTRSIPPAGQ